MAFLGIKSDSSPRTMRPFKVGFLPSSEPSSPSLHTLIHSVPATVVSGLLPRHYSLLSTQKLALAIPSSQHGCFQLFTLLASVGPLGSSLRQTVSVVIKGTDSGARLPGFKFGSITYHLCGPGPVSNESFSFLICRKTYIFSQGYRVH